MAEAGPGAAGGYVAFISYSHKDAAIGRWLHRKLEGYRLPKRLAGTQGEDGEVPARLTPIFRDRDELPAAGDLSERVRAALAVSRNLIVVCSASSAASPWVAKEIATFRELHPGRPIFTAIIESDPGQCFSPALLEGGVEPLAADLRKDGDGRRLGLLKLVAGLAGVGLDTLIQRDAGRRMRRAAAVTVVAVVAMLLTAALALIALDARRTAERQRAEAEGLVEFMLTDLRERLRGVRRLDIMTAVNQRALLYYGSQREVSTLSPDSLERRARILQAIGEDDTRRENYDTALNAFRQAHQTTGEQLARDPTNGNRVFAHSQSEYWIGYIAYLRKDYASARQSFERYKALANQLLALDGRRPEWLKEAAYAEGNLCTVALEAPPDATRALSSCAAALQRMETAARASGRINDYLTDLANRHGYVADALAAAGRREQALQHRFRRLAYVERALAADPTDQANREKRLWALRGIANLEAAIGRTGSAAERMTDVVRGVEELVRLDPEDAELRRDLRDCQAELLSIRALRKR